jgi:hypothetical protein
MSCLIFRTITPVAKYIYKTTLRYSYIFFFERERQKICHSNILEEVKINFTNRHSPIKLNNKDLDRTLTQKENDPKNPP